MMLQSLFYQPHQFRADEHRLWLLPVCKKSLLTHFLIHQGQKMSLEWRKRLPGPCPVHGLSASLSFASLDEAPDLSHCYHIHVSAFNVLKESCLMGGFLIAAAVAAGLGLGEDPNHRHLEGAAVALLGHRSGLGPAVGLWGLQECVCPCRGAPLCHHQPPKFGTSSGECGLRGAFLTVWAGSKGFRKPFSAVKSSLGSKLVQSIPETWLLPGMRVGSQGPLMECGNWNPHLDLWNRGPYEADTCWAERVRVGLWVMLPHASPAGMLLIVLSAAFEAGAGIKGGKEPINYKSLWCSFLIALS